MLINGIVYEEWKDINFFDIKPGFYKISNFGRVFSNITGKCLAPAYSNGYPTVQLSTITNGRTTFYIHRLVATAFIPNPTPDITTDVNHINLCRSDPFYLNLEWVTKEENNRHESLHKGHGLVQHKSTGAWGDGYRTYGENNGMAKLKETEVRAMLSALENGATYKEAIIAAGLEPTANLIANLSHIARGQRWKRISQEYNIPRMISRSL